MVILPFFTLCDFLYSFFIVFYPMNICLCVNTNLIYVVKQYRVDEG